MKLLYIYLLPIFSIITLWKKFILSVSWNRLYSRRTERQDTAWYGAWWRETASKWSDLEFANLISFLYVQDKLTFNMSIGKEWNHMLFLRFKNTKQKYFIYFCNLSLKGFRFCWQIKSLFYVYNQKFIWGIVYIIKNF